MTTESTETLTDKTIADFGEQWSRYTDNEGDLYGDKALLADVLGPLMDPREIEGKAVAEIGAGTGRIVRMMLDWGAATVVAVEPSDAVHALRENTRAFGDRVRVVHARGQDIPRDLGLDLVVSIGVLHHVPDPAPIVRAAFEAIAPGGRMVVWLYGHEGNALYLAAVRPLRKVTTRLPHPVLERMSQGLNVALDGYLWACRRWPRLPLGGYANHVIGGFSREKRQLVIYDQLNPAYAKYYRREEARRLLEDAGFRDVRLHHRHGYSWTVIGTRP